MFSMRNISDLKKLSNNPRIIKDKQFTTLVKSIEKNVEYFKARPLILSDRTGEFIIIAGNQRYEAAKLLNMKQVPTYLLSGLSEEQEKEITIRDNISNGEWDWSELANEWDVSDLEAWGLDTIKQNYELDEPSFSETSEEKQSIKIVFFKKDLDVIKQELESLKNEYDGFNFYE